MDACAAGLALSSVRISQSLRWRVMKKARRALTDASQRRASACRDLSKACLDCLDSVLWRALNSVMARPRTDLGRASTLSKARRLDSVVARPRTDLGRASTLSKARRLDSVEARPRTDLGRASTLSKARRLDSVMERPRTDLGRPSLVSSGAPWGALTGVQGPPWGALTDVLTALSDSPHCLVQRRRGGNWKDVAQEQALVAQEQALVVAQEQALWIHTVVAQEQALVVIQALSCIGVCTVHLCTVHSAHRFRIRRRQNE